LQGKGQLHISAPPKKVYQLISDVTRMGEWSPECYKCEWLDGATAPVVGARFRGYNRRGWLKWTTTPRITEADPGLVFAFEVDQWGGRNRTIWRYEFEPEEGGTRLTESFHVLKYVRIVTRLFYGGPQRRQAELEEGVRQTLKRIKAVAEAR